MIFVVEERLYDIEGKGLGARDVVNFLKLSCVRRVGGRGRFDSVRGLRGDDTRGEEVVCAGRKKRGQDCKE
jgi:hypothetical protein